MYASRCSQCAEWREHGEDTLGQRFTAQRIYQNLVVIGSDSALALGRPPCQRKKVLGAGVGIDPVAHGIAQPTDGGYQSAVHLAVAVGNFHPFSGFPAMQNFRQT